MPKSYEFEFTVRRVEFTGNSVTVPYSLRNGTDPAVLHRERRTCTLADAIEHRRAIAEVPRGPRRAEFRLVDDTQRLPAQRMPAGYRKAWAAFEYRDGKGEPAQPVADAAAGGV